MLLITYVQINPDLGKVGPASSGPEVIAVKPMLEMIKLLRNETGVGVMDCRKALEESEMDYDRALAALREKAALKAAKQADRQALEGRIELYSHSNGRIGIMVEVNTETEFASRSEIFRHFVHEMALQIAAAAPLYVREADIPQAVLDEEAGAAADKARQAGKPERLIERIVEGALEKYRDRHVLLRQPYIRNEEMTVAQLLNQAVQQTGENILIRRFVRWEICPET